MSNTGNTQQIIDYGATANDGTGDPLRTAFIKTDENFSNIWAAGPVGSNITIANNTIQNDSTNGNIILKPNGTGVIQANASILPSLDGVRDLGSNTRAWRRAYINIANISEITVQSALDVAGDATIQGNLTVEGDTIQIGNITTDTLLIQLANAATTDAQADGAGITVGANDDIATILYDSANNIWTTNIGVGVGGPITGTSLAVSDATIYGNIAAINGNFTGNIVANYFVGNGSLLTGITSYANANAVAYGEAGWAGNIIPAANAAYSLGNSTMYWANLWVANNTIYIGGVPLGMTAGNVLTVDGQDVITTNANGTVDLANLAVDNNNIYNTQGQGVVISNFSFIDEAETAYVQIPAGNSSGDLSVVQLQGNVRLKANAAVWTFGTNNNLTAPGNITANYFLGDGSQLTGLPEQYGNANVAAYLPTYTGNIGAGNVNFNNGSRVQTATNNINLLANVNGAVELKSHGGNYTWAFDNYGWMTLPEADAAYTPVANGSVLFGPTALTFKAGLANLIFDYTGNLTLPSEGNIVGITINNAGRIQWVGNSSGDGAGYTTLNLIPDETLTGTDQYLIIDPTVINHIHIRAGGTQDNSSADLFLGGENSYVKLPAGLDPNVEISANTLVWTFGTDGAYGELTLPSGEGIIKALDDTISLVSLNTTTGNANSVYLGSSGGLGFNDQEIGGNWLEIFRSGAEPEIRVPVGQGNLNIQTAEGANAYNWTFDNTGNLTAPGAISTTGNITAGNFIGTGSNVELVAGSEQWVFDTTGNLTLPTEGYLLVQTGIIGAGASPAPTLSGFSSIATTGSPGNISASGNLIVSGYANITGTINGTNISLSGNITGNTGGFAIGYRDIPQVTFSANTTAALADAGKHYYSTTAGNLALTLPDNANVALPTGATLTIVVNAAGNVLVNQAAGVTLYQAGSSTTGNRVVGAYGLASVMKVAANTWVISGTGVY